MPRVVACVGCPRKYSRAVGDGKHRVAPIDRGLSCSAKCANDALGHARQTCRGAHHRHCRRVSPQACGAPQCARAVRSPQCASMTQPTRSTNLRHKILVDEAGTQEARPAVDRHPRVQTEHPRRRWRRRLLWKPRRCHRQFGRRPAHARSGCDLVGGFAQARVRVGVRVCACRLHGCGRHALGLRAAASACEIRRFIGARPVYHGRRSRRSPARAAPVPATEARTSGCTCAVARATSR